MHNIVENSNILDFERVLEDKLVEYIKGTSGN
jgi:hypothetical protein